MSDIVVSRATQFIIYGFQAFLVFVTATFVFDVIHYVLHQFTKSRWRFLQWVGGLHLAHHDYFDAQLNFNENLYIMNFVKHSLPEYLTQSAVAVAALAFFDWVPVAICLGLFTTRVIVSEFILRGKDTHHRPLAVVPGRHGRVFVEATYHALHHIHRDNYMSSYTTLFDRIMGTCSQIKGKRVAMTGASGALGAPLKGLLEKEGVSVVKTFTFGKDYGYDDYSRLDGVLAETDILVLCHGSKGEDAMEANCNSFVAIIERFKELTGNRRLPAEIWAVGSESEIHPTFGNPDKQAYQDSKRAFARHARRYYADPAIVYRHIVPAGYKSRMGWGLISGATVAKASLFLIRRGFRYIPVTYTGFAFLNFFKFLLFVKPAKAPNAQQAPERQWIGTKEPRGPIAQRQPREEMAQTV